MDSNDIYDVEDYQKRYSGTFVQIKKKDTGDTCVVSISKIIAIDNEWEAGVNFDGRPKKITSADWEIVEGFPPIGVTNCGRDVIITSRIPARQWKRGICHDNFLITNPLAEIIERRELPEVLDWPITTHCIDDDTIKHCYENMFFDIEDAIKKVSTLERVGAAVNNVFWFSPSWYNSSIILWYKNAIVGEYKENKLVVLEKAFQQEIKDVFGETLCLI